MAASKPFRQPAEQRNRDHETNEQHPQTEAEPMNHSEARRRMPAVELIDDVDLREQTVAEVARFPDYFWTAPATSSDRYHNHFARGERGLWIHVLMAATALERVVDSHVAQDRLDEDEADHARSAVLLHDGRKYGERWRPGQSADKDHDLQMFHVLQRRGFPPGVADAVASHMGAWYQGPSPSTPLQHIVHEADMLASARHVTPAVYYAPDELVDAAPDLPRCRPDDSAPRTTGDQSGLAEFGGGAP